MHLKRQNEFLLNQMTGERGEELNDNINNNNLNYVKKEPSKKDVMKIVFQGFVIIVVGIIGLLFALIIVPGPIVIISIFFGIIAGVVWICHFVGKWFSSQK